MTSPHIAECEVALFLTVTYSFFLKSKMKKACRRVYVCVCGSNRVRERGEGGREGESKCYSWLVAEILAYGKSAVGKW